MSVACAIMLSGAAILFSAIGLFSYKTYFSDDEKRGLSYIHLAWIVVLGGILMITGGVAI